VSERKDVLSGFFGLLALMAYARYVQWRRHNAEGRMQKPAAPNTQPSHVERFTFHASSFYLLSLFLFALGLMSKPMLVTWPLVMLLLDYWPLRRFELSISRSQLAILWRLVAEKIPFFILVALMSVVTFMAQKHGGAVEAVGNLPISARIGNALISYGRYLGKLLCPMDLAVIYPRPDRWPVVMVVLAGGLILGFSLLLWVRRRRSPALLVGWLWFLGTLVPVIGLVQVGEQAMADRYSYLPSLGVLVLAIWGLYELTQGWRYQVMALSVAGCGASVLCLVLTRQQLEYWKDSEALFRHALEVTANNYLAHNDLGNAIGKKGQLDEAIRHYEEAIRLKPDYVDAHNNLGAAFGKKRQTDQAIAQYQEAIRLNPAHALAHHNLGAALAKKGQTDEAIVQFHEAIRLNPDYPDAYNNLGVALGNKSQTDEAIRQFREAIRLNPDHTEARNNLGVALGKKGQTEEAIRQYEEIIRLKPDQADAHNNLGIAFYQQGRAAEAIRQFEEALRLKPDYAEARRNLDIVLAAKPVSSPPSGASTNR
jgi:Flp pilus assembly protein TadD